MPWRSCARSVALLTVASLAAAGRAYADPDFRPQDRFYFGACGGVAATSTGSIAETITPAKGGAPTTLGGSNVSAALGAFGLVVSYWPDDYAGIGMDTEMFAVPSPGLPLAARSLSWGMPLRLAVPLRYIQPYVGVWGGLTANWVRGGTVAGEDVVPLGTGAEWSYRLMAGTNVYVNRNLRFFVEYQYAPLRLDSTGHGGLDQVSYQSMHADLLLAGVLWSPELFHDTRPLVKLDLVWWSMLTTVTVWGLANYVTWHRW